MKKNEIVQAYTPVCLCFLR